jgi:hypothetical protein
VPEIAHTPVGVVTAAATADAIDALVVPDRASACRVADDELMLLCDPAVAADIALEVRTRLTVLDPDAVVMDATDGWFSLTIQGEDAGSAFGSLSRLELPDRGFIQGEVAHVAAKIVVEDSRIGILVSAALEHHLCSRVARLVPTERSA